MTSSTLSHLLDLAALPAADIPASARSMARFSLFDWMVCGQAGVDEPLAVILRDHLQAEGGRPVASVIGGRAGGRRGRRHWSTARQAMRWIMTTPISAMSVTLRSPSTPPPLRWPRRWAQGPATLPMPS